MIDTLDNGIDEALQIRPDSRISLIQLGPYSIMQYPEIYASTYPVIKPDKPFDLKKSISC